MVFSKALNIDRERCLHWRIQPLRFLVEFGRPVTLGYDRIRPWRFRFLLLLTATHTLWECRGLRT